MDRAEAPRTMNPTKVFAVLAGLVIVIAGAFYLTRSDPAPTPDPSPPDFSLTDTEALTRYRELHELNIRAYEERDQSLIHAIYTDDSKVVDKVRREIRMLRRDAVLSRTAFEITSLRVVQNTTDEIVLREELVIRPKFLSETGQDLTKGKPQQQSLRITLHREADQWLIFDALITASEPL